VVDDWYRISLRQIASHGSVRFSKYYGGLYGALSTVYPEHTWHYKKSEQMLSAKKASQRWLATKLREMFSHLPDSAFKEEFIPPDLIYNESREPITIDVFIAPFRLGLEYHGAQHYYRTKSSSLVLRQKLDVEKQQTLENAGITVIAIPYWWDLRLESLAAMIADKRPDLVPVQQKEMG